MAHLEARDGGSLSEPTMPRTPKNPSQSFRGVPFYRQVSGYYASGRGYRTTYMHRAVWEHYCGPIPDGMHVHHKDGDPANNLLSNLELVDGVSHNRAHSRDRSDLHRFVAAGHAWLRSPEGREKRAELTRQYMESRKPMQCACQVCGAAFLAHGTRTARWCGQACYKRHRRAKGLT